MNGTDKILLRLSELIYILIYTYKLYTNWRYELATKFNIRFN